MPNAPTSLFPVVAAALIDAGGRILVQQRPPGKQMAGLWEFPGGKVELGETPEAALLRELREELGIEIAVPDLTSVAFASEPLDGKHLLLLLYVCRAWHGTPVALDAVALRWATPQEMRALAMPPADAPFIDVLERLIRPALPPTCLATL